MKTISRLMLSAAFSALTLSPMNAQSSDFIGKNDIKLSSDRMTPEALWAMGRIGSYAVSPDGQKVVYQVGYYSVKQNKGHQVLYIMNTDGSDKKQLTTSAKSETDPAWIEGGSRIAFIHDGQVWTSAPDGTDRKQLTKEDDGVEGFKFSPDGKKIVIIKQVPTYTSIQKRPDDLPKSTGLVINDMNYRHWDEYVETIPHPFVADVTADGIQNIKDILKDEPYESPVKPFGGTEQLDWSKDSKCIAYTSRKKTGVQYAISTDTDIYLYNTETGETKNLCKPADYKEPAIDPTKTMANQSVNSAENLKNNPGYDTNPQFSPDGKYIAWQSMARNGYESDRNRLCIYDLATGTKTYITETLDTNVDGYAWSPNTQQLFFTAVWHGKTQIYSTNLKGEVKQITDGQHDFGSLQVFTKNNISNGKRNRKAQVYILAERHAMDKAAELYLIEPSQAVQTPDRHTQVTDENGHLYKQMAFGKVEERWCKTFDGKDMLYWVILPSNFDPNKKYPTLLFCEGGPQSPVSQFWSYRWNFQIMAANDYVIVAPNRRGLPGFGHEWNEAVSGDWTGKCMKDYLTAIDDACDKLPYVDRNRLGCVGASFGGFSVYYLASHHEKRFKAFISHDGAFNLEAMYTDTEEAWFSNWEYDDAYWNKDQTSRAKTTYANSPHRFVDKWDTPILCIHGEKDYRINANQGFGAFNAARLRGIPAQLLLYPDENHWVLKPQNGILWQRTFFAWLDKYLK
ncbi:MAG: S9 family peptidase [Bacteroidaceae bacterium]|nr:S9 family peptidase [Bacteroidaceae bacterium]